MDAALEISRETGLDKKKVEAVVTLLEDGATIWFIARYRKEKTGSLDEVAISDIRDRLEALKALSDRKKAILKSLTERDLLTEELSAAIEKQRTLTELEDLYEGYRPKRQTRATKAVEKGLAPLAEFIRSQTKSPLRAEIAKYISSDKDVPDAAAALAGGR
ncbi:MAG TPA: RNA-binding transcriptional accessory protein, partial [Desulfobacteraceae bacterium]|nr:RNA-binding transcriptional accessory protein [Desulfobacteraceae bacterium]